MATKNELLKSVDKLTGLSKLIAGKKGPIAFLKDYDNLVLHGQSIKTNESDLEWESDIGVLSKTGYSTRLKAHDDIPAGSLGFDSAHSPLPQIMKSKSRIALLKTHYGDFVEIQEGVHLQFEIERFTERQERNGRVKVVTRVRIVEGTPVYAALAKFGANERFVVHQDLRVSPVIQPNFVLGWRKGRLVLVSKQNVKESLVFGEFEPTIPL